MTRHTVLWLAAIDWDAPWHGQQTLASRLAAAGHAVTFVETLGVRAAQRRDWGRLARRLHNRVRGGLWGFRPLAPNLWLFSPVLLPLPGRAGAERLNRRLLMASLRRLPGRDPAAPLLIWTYLPTPLAARVVQDLQPDRLIYYCIDNFSHNLAGVAPGLAESEAWLTRRADHVFATSRELYAARQEHNPRTLYLPEAADVAPFLAPHPEPADVARLPRPRLCFFGTLNLRLDQDLLLRVAAAYPHGSLVLVGPVQCDVSRLRACPNVHLLGARDHADLPAYLQAMDLFLIPYRDTPYTRSIHPVKTYEALATGKPLVTTYLPELLPYAGAVTVTGDGDAFLQGVAAGLAETDPAPSTPLRAGLAGRRREIARQNTWDARYRVILEALPELT